MSAARKLGRQPRQETYYARRRHALARVEKALRTPTVVGVLRPQVPPEAVEDVVRLAFFMRTSSDFNARRPGHQWHVDIPFDLAKPDIVRLLLVRARLEGAKHGTPAHG